MADNALLEQVKRKLNVTWSDEDTEARINDIILVAEQDIRSLLGIPQDENVDFTKQGIESGLFLNHCWYQWEGVLDEFESNYGAIISRCRDGWMVKQYVEEQEASADV